MRTNVKNDGYTKFILTIIALCLIWICLREVKIIPELYAASSDIVDVRIKSIERAPGENWEPLGIEIIGPDSQERKYSLKGKKKEKEFD